MQRSVPQVVERIGAPDLAKIDDARVLPILVVDVGGVEVAVGEVSLLGVEPVVMSSHDIPHRPHLVVSSGVRETAAR